MRCCANAASRGIDSNEEKHLTFGAKINCTFAALAAVLALTVWFGFHTDGHLCRTRSNMRPEKHSARSNWRDVLNTAASDMAVASAAPSCSRTPRIRAR